MRYLLETNLHLQLSPEWKLTPKNVVLVILVGVRANFDEASQAIVLHKLVNQVFVFLETEKQIFRIVKIYSYSSRKFKV